VKRVSSEDRRLLALGIKHCGVQALLWQPFHPCHIGNSVSQVCYAKYDTGQSDTPGTASKLTWASRGISLRRVLLLVQGTQHCAQCTWCGADKGSLTSCTQKAAG
jgi:hypothetical protein